MMRFLLLLFISKYLVEGSSLLKYVGLLLHVFTIRNV